MAGCDLTVKFTTGWVYPLKFWEADPYRDFFGIETANHELKIGRFFSLLYLLNNHTFFKFRSAGPEHYRNVRRPDCR